MAARGEKLILLRNVKLITIVPILTACVVSMFPAFSALVAVITFPREEIIRIESADSQSESGLIERTIQNHFQKYGVYISQTDIVAKSVKEDRNGSRLVIHLLGELCGEGNLHVWVPLRVYVPIIGDEVMEWCWTPSTGS